MSDTLVSLAALAGLVLTSLGLGHALLRGARLYHVGADLATTLGLGWIAAGLLLTAAGLLGLWRAPFIQAATLAGTLWGCRCALGWARRWGHSRSAPRPRSRGHLAWLVRGCTCLAGAVAAASLLAALRPVTAGDALCYHLQLPKEFLARGALVDLPLDDNVAYPLLAEVWFLWAMALDGPVAAQLVHWSLGVLLAMAAAGLAREVLGLRRDADHEAAEREADTILQVGTRRSVRHALVPPLTAALVLLVPGVANQMTAPLNDVALAAFTTLALTHWLRALRCTLHGNGRRRLCAVEKLPASAHGSVLAQAPQRSQRPHDRQESPQSHEPQAMPGPPAMQTRHGGQGAITHHAANYIVCGVLLGGAVSIKYVALIFAAALAAHAVWLLVRCAFWRRPLAQGAALVAVATLATGGLWYARAAVLRGNPVYPFLSGVFASRGAPPARSDKTPLRLHPCDIVQFPWQVTMHPERFGGRGHQPGGLFLAVLPSLVAARRLRRLATLLVLAAMFAGGCYVLRQNVRFLLPAVPILALACAWAVYEMRRWPAVPRRAALGTIAILAASQAGIALRRAADAWPVVLGCESRDAYLARCEPTYRAAQWMAQHLPRGAHLLSQEHRALYFPCRTTRENIYRRHTDYAARLASPAELPQWLRREGFTHLLLAEASGGTLRYEPVLRRLAEAAQRADPSSLRLLLDYTFCEADGTQRRYRLLEIAPP
jgi:hypothetical protein